MDKTFKLSFAPSNQTFSKIKLEKTSNVLTNFKTEIGNSTPKEIYYDEIIYYDGGGVDGYGDEN